MDDKTLLQRLRFTDGSCPFCGREPYHYVDIGVGMERAAVNCCGLGLALFQYGDEQLSQVLANYAEAADTIEAQATRIDALEAALREICQPANVMNAIAIAQQALLADALESQP